MSDRVATLMGIAAFVMGIWILFFQSRARAWRQRRYDARLAERRARGTDAYFEELRELESYPPEAVSPPMERVFGALLIIGGVALAALAFNR